VNMDNPNSDDFLKINCWQSGTMPIQYLDTFDFW
jgi:hypothetical protein